eukprot:1428231-Prorocentrum_lima.AAC.1
MPGPWQTMADVIFTDDPRIENSAFVSRMLFVWYALYRLSTSEERSTSKMQSIIHLEQNADLFLGRLHPEIQEHVQSRIAE